MVVTERQKRKSRRKLLKFLDKLGVRPPRRSPFDYRYPVLSMEEHMEDMMDTVMESFGKPDQIIMSGDALKTLIDAIGEKDEDKK